MRVARWFKPLAAASLAGALIGGSATLAWAQDAPQQGAAAEGTAAPTADPYAVPDGTPEELLEFLQELLTTPPSDRSQEGRQAHLDNVIDAALAATTKIMQSDKATGQQAARAAEIKLQILGLAARIGREDAEQQLEDFRKSIRENKRQAVRAVMVRRDLLQQVANWRQLDEAEREQWMQALVEHLLQSADLDGQHGQLVMDCIRTLGQQGDKEAATKLVNLAKPIFERSSDEQIAALAKRLEGAARYMNLEGSQMDVEGRLISGAAFDWSQYDDKVVLVDFWATWCGPCIRELPNVIDNYQQYHGKGFEVVGISLDTDAEAVREFVEKRDIPWPILFSDDPNATGWNHPMAVKYGIQGIPAAVLVNREGKVVSKHARGETLGNLLQELLGDPLGAEGSNAQTDEAATSPTGG